jgi:amino acid transporter
MKFLSKQSRFGTPWVALVINSLLVAAGTVFSFQFLIQLDQLFYSIGLLLEYLSLLVLRYKVKIRYKTFSRN